MAIRVVEFSSGGYKIWYPIIESSTARIAIFVVPYCIYQRYRVFHNSISRAVVRGLLGGALALPEFVVLEKKTEIQITVSSTRFENLRTALIFPLIFCLKSWYGCHSVRQKVILVLKTLKMHF